MLDTVPDSANHALTWVAPADLPEAFVEGTMTGSYVGPHSDDLLRGAALYTYGGVWMDVGCILFRHLHSICWAQLGDDASSFSVAAPLVFGQFIANHIVASRKGDEFMKNWCVIRVPQPKSTELTVNRHLIFLELWKGRTDFTGVLQSPLINFITWMKFEDLVEAGFGWSWKLDEQTIIGYIGQCVAWMRLTWLQEPNGSFNGVNYWANKVLLWSVLPEDFPAENTIGFDGADILNVFATRLDGNGNEAGFEKAVWTMMAQSVMQKITHGKELTHKPHCGTLLDLPEHEGKDAAPETFGELLRYGSVHLEQTREMQYVTAAVVDPEFVIHKGLLEA